MSEATIEGSQRPEIVDAIADSMALSYYLGHLEAMEPDGFAVTRNKAENISKASERAHRSFIMWRDQARSILARPQKASTVRCKPCRH